MPRRDWSLPAVTSPSDRDVTTVAQTLQRMMRRSEQLASWSTSRAGCAGGCGVT